MLVAVHGQVCLQRVTNNRTKNAAQIWLISKSETPSEGAYSLIDISHAMLQHTVLPQVDL